MFNLLLLDVASPSPIGGILFIVLFALFIVIGLGGSAIKLISKAINKKKQEKLQEEMDENNDD